MGVVHPFSQCTRRAHCVLVLLEPVAEEGGEVGLGHDAAHLLHQQLHLVLVCPHRRPTVRVELHHGEEGTEQMAFGVVVIALYQLVWGSGRKGRKRRLRVRQAQVRPPSTLRPPAHSGQLCAGRLVVLLVDALHQAGDLVQGEAARVETHGLPPREDRVSQSLR